MIGELNIAGVFLPTLLVCAVLALLVSLPLRWVLERAGFYRIVWHRALFDICVVTALWRLAAAVVPSWLGGVAS